MSQDMFIKIDGIPGESQDAAHPDEIDVVGWDWTVRFYGANQADFSGRISKDSGSDFRFSHNVDRASPSLAQYCYTGRHIPQAILTTRRTGGAPHEFVRMTFTDVVITELRPSAGSHSCQEEVCLSFLKLKYEYIAQRADGGKGPTTTALLDSRALRNQTYG